MFLGNCKLFQLKSKPSVTNYIFVTWMSVPLWLGTCVLFLRVGSKWTQWDVTQKCIQPCFLLWLHSSFECPMGIMLNAKCSDCLNKLMGGNKKLLWIYNSSLQAYKSNGQKQKKVAGLFSFFLPALLLLRVLRSGPIEKRLLFQFSIKYVMNFWKGTEAAITLHFISWNCGLNKCGLSEPTWISLILDIL